MSPSTGITSTGSPHPFEFWGLNSGPCVCTADSLLTEPCLPPALHLCFFIFRDHSSLRSVCASPTSPRGLWFLGAHGSSSPGDLLPTSLGKPEGLELSRPFLSPEKGQTEWATLAGPSPGEMSLVLCWITMHSAKGSGHLAWKNPFHFN